MNEEPIYVDDPFEEEDNAWQYIVDLPIETIDLVQDAFKVTRRPSMKFRKPAEKRQWKNITSKIVKGQMPRKWVRHCINFAKEKNSGRNYGVAYTFETLTKYILNQAAMEDWLAKNPSARIQPGNY